MIYNAIELRDKMEEELKNKIEKSRYDEPCLAIIQVGNHPQSNKYVGNKIKALDRVGMRYRHIQFSEKAGVDDIVNTIKSLNEDKYVDGIMVQLPLPHHLIRYSECIINHIKPSKDVDGLTHDSMGKLAMRTNQPFHAPCTALGIMKILNHIDPELNLRGRNVVVLGKGFTSGLPISLMMMKEGANVVNLSSGCKPDERYNYLIEADVVISCTGQPNLIQRDDIIGPCILINVGMNVNEEGKLVGDYDPKEFENDHHVYCTSITNSTGIMTVQMLLENTFNAQLWRK